MTLNQTFKAAAVPFLFGTSLPISKLQSFSSILAVDELMKPVLMEFNGEMQTSEQQRIVIHISGIPMTNHRVMNSCCSLSRNHVNEQPSKSAAGFKLVQTLPGPPGSLQHHRRPRWPESGRRRGQEVVPHRHLHQGGTVGAQLGRSGRSRPDRPPGQRQEMKPAHWRLSLPPVCRLTVCTTAAWTEARSSIFMRQEPKALVLFVARSWDAPKLPGQPVRRWTRSVCSYCYHIFISV